MKLIEAHAKILALKRPLIQTSDVAACLRINRSNASQILRRLAAEKLIIHIKRGIWAFSSVTDPLLLPEYLTAPSPSYISLQTALYYHGMISQIPSITYAVSLARTRKYSTPCGTISIHHLDPAFFFGFENQGKENIKMAVPEKALLDLLYLSTVRSQWFKTLPELELSKKFQVKLAFAMIEKIPTSRLKTIVKTKFSGILVKMKKS